MKKAEIQIHLFDETDVISTSGLTCNNIFGLNGLANGTPASQYNMFTKTTDTESWSAKSYECTGTNQLGSGLYAVTGSNSTQLYVNGKASGSFTALGNGQYAVTTEQSALTTGTYYHYYTGLTTGTRQVVYFWECTDESHHAQ